MNIHKLLALGALLALTPACSSPGGGDTGNPLGRSDTLLDTGIRQLSAGEYERARASFNELLTLNDPDYTCRAQYGIVLAGVQDTAARLDVIADSAALMWMPTPAAPWMKAIMSSSVCANCASPAWAPHLPLIRASG